MDSSRVFMNSDVLGDSGVLPGHDFLHVCLREPPDWDNNVWLGTRTQTVYHKGCSRQLSAFTPGDARPGHENHSGLQHPEPLPLPLAEGGEEIRCRKAQADLLPQDLMAPKGLCAPQGLCMLTYPIDS